MGLCCSCLEDDTRPYGRSSPPLVYTEQPRSQQRRRHQTLSASHLLAPVRSSTTTTVQVVQQSVASAIQRPVSRQNLLIEPGIAVRVVPKSRTQRVAIVEVQHCEACGQSDHTMSTCRYRERLCFYCREEGHIISVCPAKKRQQ